MLTRPSRLVCPTGAVDSKRWLSRVASCRFRAASVTSKEQLQADLWTAVDIGDIKVPPP